MPTTSVPHPLILICDDSANDIRAVLSVLRPRQYRLAMALNGRDVCDRAFILRPDLILLDVRMPVMDGLTTCRLLKARRETRDIPVIFLSAADSQEERLLGLQCGAVDYIVKPAHPQELQLRVSAHLRQPSTPPQSEEDDCLPFNATASVAACVQYMLANLSAPYSPKSVCELLGLNHLRLHAEFVEAFGMTPMAWLRERRLEQARRWLSSTSLSIHTIAANLGFVSSSNFATAFRKRFEMTPSDFRAASRGTCNLAISTSRPRQTGIDSPPMQKVE